MTFKRLLSVCSLVVFLAGCNLAMPNWLKPGTATEQRKRAERYDPYPESEMAPSAGSLRPREYSDPMPEPGRARWQVGNVAQ